MPAMTLDEARARIGEPVAYRAHDGAAPEFGVITSVGDTFVFVRYGSDSGSKATRPEELDSALVSVEALCLR